jgi:hypothetical protein
MTELIDKNNYKNLIFLEFANECECLLQEVQPELQQYFMQFGYDFMFMDLNLNFDFDPFLDPYLFEACLKELDECFKRSDGCFFLVSTTNSTLLKSLSPL